VPNGGVIVTAGPAANVHRERINALMVRHRLPAVYPFRYYAESGGLVGYGRDIISQCAMAIFAEKIPDTPARRI
jgi:putative tryptophan/tyrosine transport system substrate-binding protein